MCLKLWEVRLKEYSVEGLLLELAKIKKIELLDGSEVTSG
jgi:hypothetical protein